MDVWHPGFWLFLVQGTVGEQNVLERCFIFSFFYSRFDFSRRCNSWDVSLEKCWEKGAEEEDRG
jgi:hypothetical protein